MKTVIEMAREANLPACHTTHPKALERFAELVRADEREKYKWDIHSCGPTCKKVACVAVREAVEAEREACAKLVEDAAGAGKIISCISAAAAIRARGNT